MIQNSVQSTISELRDEAQEINMDGLFKKSLLRGYNVKQVTEHIESLNEKLKDSEESLNDKTREFASTIAKLTQERDLYGEMFNMCKQSKLELEEQIDSLIKESEKLKREPPLSQDKIKLYDELVVQNKKLEEELDRQKIYEQEYTNLKEQFAKLKLRGEELSSELADYSQYDDIEGNLKSALLENEKIKKKCETLNHDKYELTEENKRLQKQCEKAAENRRRVPFNSEVVSDKNKKIMKRKILSAKNKEFQERYEMANKERNYLLAENSELINRNKRLTADLSEFSVKNEELKRINNKTEATMNQMITEFDSRTAVYALKYQRSIDRISESLKNANETLKYEIADADHFLGAIFRQNNQ